MNDYCTEMTWKCNDPSICSVLGNVAIHLLCKKQVTPVVTNQRLRYIPRPRAITLPLAAHAQRGVTIKTLLKRDRGDYRTLPCSVSEQLKTCADRHGRPELSCQPRHLVLAASSKIKVHVSTIDAYSLSSSVYSHLHGITSVECMNGVYVTLVLLW